LNNFVTSFVLLFVYYDFFVVEFCGVHVFACQYESVTALSHFKESNKNLVFYSESK